MKRITKFVSIILMAFLLGACSQAKKESKDKVVVLEEEGFFEEDQVELASTVGEYRRVLNEIEADLATIDEMDDQIIGLTPSGENIEPVGQNIFNHIENISVILDDNRERLADLQNDLRYLRKKSKGYPAEIAALEKKVSSLSAAILQKDMEIADLTEGMAELGEDYAILAEAYERQVELNEELLEELNSAFVYSATKKELKDEGVMDKKGGFIGLGRVKMVDNDADNEKFMRIDVTETKEIPLNSKNAKLISNHPEDSFTFIESKEGVESLVITDAEKFWDKSKYLVIQHGKPMKGVTSIPSETAYVE